jgi:putative ABC transport system permease protein
MSRRDDRGALVRLGLSRPRLRIRDWLNEATLSVTRNAGRSVITAIGNVLGAAAIVATSGLGATMAAQVSASFDLRRSTEVVVSNETKGQPYDWQTDAALARLRGLNGVVAAGRRVDMGERAVARTVTTHTRQLKVMGADPGALAAIGPRMVVGRSYDLFHEREAAAVVLLPASIAATLSINRIGVAVFINERPFSVMGIFDDVARRPESLLAMLMPASSADGLVDPSVPIDRDVVVATAPGAAQVIGAQAALALRPQGPDVLRTVAPPDPRTLRREVEGDVTRSTVLLSAVALAVGALSIANAATSTISTRVSEIGLRRAMGARRVHIFAQLLGETTAVGASGGAIGVVAGIVVVAVVSMVNGWRPVLDLTPVLTAVVVGAGGGLLAGLWPAMRAMRIQPVAALRQ